MDTGEPVPFWKDVCREIPSYAQEPTICAIWAAMGEAPEPVFPLIRNGDKGHTAFIRSAPTRQTQMPSTHRPEFILQQTA
jgi:hypothetical protein